MAESVNSGMSNSAWIAGSFGFVSVNIQNQSQRRVEKMTVQLVERIKTFTREGDLKNYSALDFSPSSLTPVAFVKKVVSEKVYVANMAPPASGAFAMLPPTHKTAW